MYFVLSFISQISLFLEKFTLLAKILHCRWHWRHGQIPPLAWGHQFRKISSRNPFLGVVTGPEEWEWLILDSINSVLRAKSKAFYYLVKYLIHRVSCVGLNRSAQLEGGVSLNSSSSNHSPGSALPFALHWRRNVNTWWAHTRVLSSSWSS